MYVVPLQRLYFDRCTGDMKDDIVIEYKNSSCLYVPRTRCTGMDQWIEWTWRWQNYSCRL